MLSHFGFLAAMFYEQHNEVVSLILILLVSLLLFITYSNKKIASRDKDLASFWSIVFIGAISTYILHTSFGWNTVLAAGTIGLIVSYLPSLNNKSEFLKNIPSAVYCGTFVGMSSLSSSPDYLFITVASIFTGFLLIGTKNAFYGYGGKLGSLAFGGVAITFFIFFILIR